MATGDKLVNLDDLKEVYTKVDGDVGDLKSALNSMEPEVGQLRENVDALNEGGLVLKDEVIRGQIDNWLDDHPEATTTVEDGAITLPKLNSSLQNVAIIRETTDKSYYHNATPETVTVYPNEYTQTIPFRYAGSENLVDGAVTNSGTQTNITRTADGRIVKVSGTGGGGGFNFLETTDSVYLNKLKGKTVNVCIYIKKSTAWENSSYLSVRVNDSSSIARVNFGPTSGTLLEWTVLENVEFPSTLTKVRIYINSLSSTFATGDFYWLGIYETTPVVTETVVTTDPEKIVVSGLTKIDTMMHESEVEYVKPIKAYVDEHTPDIIGYWSENVYVMPEHFGAVGDGVADDTQAINDCIAYAVTSGKAVKGFGKYKTSDTIEIDGQYLNVYLREINYTGNDTAVILENSYMVFEFHRITSTSVGIVFGGSNPYARHCQVKGNEIASTSHCMQIDDLVLYCTVEVRYLRSTDADCIYRNHVSTWGGMEFIYRSSSCSCPKGYVVNNIGSSKFYDFTVEGNCKYGLLNPTDDVCIGWRHREQTDRISLRIFNGETQYDNGALIVFSTPCGDGIHGFKYITSDSLPWYAIDLSAIQGYEKMPASGQGSMDAWNKLSYNGVDIGVSVHGAQSTARENIGEKVFIIGNNKVFVPGARKTVIINQSTCDFRLLESMADADIYVAKDIIKKMGTDFCLDVQHTDIYFNASFGAVGYNDLTLTQDNGNTATIYDKLGNVLFDGTNAGNGKWRLQCSIDRSSNGRYDSVNPASWWCYDGTNEVWEITKLS